MNLRDLMNKLDTIAEAADAAAVWTPTPEQAKWLGGANQQDPYILSRMPGTKPPITWFTDPADQAKAKQMGFPEAPATPAVSTQPATTATAATAAATSDKVNGDALNKLNDLAFKLSQLKGVTGSTQPGVVKPPATKPPATKPGVNYTKVATPPAASAMPDMSGTGGNAMEESYNSDIANALMESFGYTKLDEAPAWLQNLKGATNTATTNAKTAGSNVVNTIKANPKKSAAIAAGAVGAGLYGLNKLGGNNSTTVVPGGNKKTPSGSTQPAAGGTATPEQQAIIDEMMKIMASLEGVEDPQTLAALANAQQQISAVTASKAQSAQDTATAGAARDAADAAPAAAPVGNQPDANQSSAETNRLKAQNAAAAPAAAPVGTAANGVNAAGQNVTMPNGINPETGMPTASVQPVKEDELARWLKIARG